MTTKALHLNPFSTSSILKSMLIDTHNHLHDPEFDTERDAVIERTQSVGIDRIILI